MNDPAVDVLVVGAGPVGLALALDVVAHGGTVRVLERRAGPDRPSRAMIVQPRTLEVLRPLGVVGELLAQADTAPAADLHVGRRIVPVRLAAPALDGTPFPHLTMIRQRSVEDVLRAALARRGVEVEWGCELVTLAGPGGGTPAAVRAGSRLEAIEARFVAGCDSTDSTVRRLLGIAWPGRFSPVEVVLADIDLCGSVRPGRLQVAVGADGLVFVFALGEGAPWRLLATQVRGPVAGGSPGEPVPLEHLQALVARAGFDAIVQRATWSARIPLQHRLARHFSTGSVFLAGDAAHTHTPAAAQGMNSGIQDVTNLGWKLAFAARAGLGESSPLLRSYGLERRPVARQVRTLTDAVFAAEASPALLPRLLRGGILPMVAPLLPFATRQPILMSTVLWLLSQGWVRYRSSPLSVDADPGAPGPRPGDQVRDRRLGCDGREVWLHELTARPGVHVLLSRDTQLGPDWPSGPVTTHRISSWAGTRVVAVRPDGHVGFRSPDGTRLADWLSLVGAKA